ncbi:MAG: hypothetical protein AUREO_057560 [Aureobasidium pullulans]|nr:MAG: hypothetical protein AUREO_057560 [Aureobasidium pullulans]
MADASAPTQSQNDQSANRGRSNRGRGGRAGNRAPREGQDGEQTQGNNSNRNAGKSRGRGGRGRGGAGGAHAPTDSRDQPTTEQQIQAKGKALALVPQGEDGEDVEAEVCFICASPVVHQSVAPCNHRTCHICSLRLRALYKTKTCAHCRTSAEEVIFTDDANKRFEDYNTQQFAHSDDNLGIRYESQDIFEDTILLLRYNCPDSSCDAACLGWPDLHRHVKSVHHKQMCDLCTRNKKVFTHEHELFTPQELRRHEKHGDDIPGAENQSGFKGHPECGFCRQRFYGDDELFSHCRDRHERCHLCDRRDGGRQPQYYVDYNALEVHFRKDHFVCPDQECLEKKFVVFDSEMDLKAHQLEAHPNGLTKDARRDARRVDISGFDYRAPHQQDRPQRNPNRERRGGGRGRDPNADPLPVSSAQPMGRAEMAYQRQMAIQSAQSVSTRSFGGQLTQPTEAYAARAPANAPEPATVTATRPARQDLFPSLGSLSLQPTSAIPRSTSPDRSMADLTPQEQARRLRHNAVNERASNLLRNDQTKLAEFRNKVSLYRQGAMTADHLIDAFFSLFDTSSTELGKLVKELADIFEIATKRDQLLKAWNNWRSINEDYPSLPHAAGGQSGPSTSAASVLGNGIGSKRILNLKSSTAQSSRSNNTRSYGSAVAPHSGGNPSSAGGLSFPPLSASSRSSTPAAPPVRVNPSQASWLNSAPASARPTPQPSRSGTPSNSKPPGRGGDIFPSLPKAQKPTSTVFSPGYTGAGVRRVNAPGPSNVAWGSGSSSNVQSPPAVEESPEQRTVRKGKQGKKQVLFNWG